MTPFPPLDWLRAFEAAARHASFTAAASEIGLTQAAVSQHIRKLEEHLGTPLFRRLPRGVELTVDGAAYLPHVQAAFGVLARSTQDMFQRSRRTPVKLVCPPSFAGLWLAPRLPALIEAQPGLRVNIAVVAKPGDYEAEAGDMEVRFGAGEWQAHESAALLPEALAPVASPALAAGIGNWTEAPRIAVTGPRDGWSQWSAAAGVALGGPLVARFDTLLIALAAARAGSGVLLASLPLARGALEERSLVQLHEHVLQTGTGHFLSRDRARRRSADAEAVWSWLLEAAR